MKIKVGVSSLANYQRMPYSLHYALGELVDNSIQAYFDERKELDKLLKKEKRKLHIRIDYDRKLDTLSVVDNSSGITRKRLQEAFEIGSHLDRKNKNTALGQFNVGMKAAAIWLADEWSIRTKRFDSENELELQIINEDVFGGNDEIIEQERPAKNIKRHFTILEFEKVRKKHSAPAVKKTKRYLASMYRRHLNKSVEIYWGDEKLEWEEFRLAKKEDGSEYKWNFGPGEIKGGEDRREVRGWIGVLESGGERPDLGSSYSNAGFSIIRRGRMIQGYPDAWKPKNVFGQTGTGSLINQRVVGEVEFDQGDVSYDKSTIAQDDLEILDTYFGDFLRGEGVRQIANRKVTEKTKPNPDEDKGDLKEVQESIESSDLDKRSNQPIPPDEVVEQRIDRTFKSAAKEEVHSFNIKNYKINLVTSYKNESDPFVAYKSPTNNEIKAVINMDHPYLTSNLVTKNEYFLFIILMIASRYKIETDDRYTMDNYFEVLDQVMRLKISRK